jgi:hypothetical protein
MHGDHYFFIDSSIEAGDALPSVYIHHYRLLMLMGVFLMNDLRFTFSTMLASFVVTEQHKE